MGNNKSKQSEKVYPCEHVEIEPTEVEKPAACASTPISTHVKKQSFLNPPADEYAVVVNGTIRGFVIDRANPGPDYVKEFDAGNYIKYTCKGKPDKYFRRNMTLKNAQFWLTKFYKDTDEDNKKHREMRNAIEIEKLYKDNAVLQYTIVQQRKQLKKLRRDAREQLKKLRTEHNEKVKQIHSAHQEQIKQQTCIVPIDENIVSLHTSADSSDSSDSSNEYTYLYDSEMTLC